MVCLLPIILDTAKTALEVTVMLFILLITVCLILWVAFDIKYVFEEHHLFIKGGPFRSRIKYEDITRVTPTNNILVGYRILSSKDALEILYKTGILGSIIISPKNKEEFILELARRCPNASISE
ncbi:PH domain-containing protein [Cytobacillus sp. FJAT-54145]|uniref:PH domain-containing protein n=1 Tax=Cytobacillus spartinae TaxID=3299023 RepID=A0ABW6K7V3_9BACI